MSRNYNASPVVKKILKGLGLVDVTTKRQSKLGTVSFEDSKISWPYQRILYSITKSGHVLRTLDRLGSKTSYALNKRNINRSYVTYPGKPTVCANLLKERVKKYRAAIR